MEQNESNLNKKQNHKVTIFACLLSVISIGLLVFGFMAVSSDKVVMLQSVSNLTNKLDQLLDSDEQMELLDKIASNDNVGVRYNMSLEKGEEQFRISINSLQNKKEQRSQLDLTLANLQEELLDASIITDQNRLHFFAENITPKYYFTTLQQEAHSSSSFGGKDFNRFLEILKEAINNCIEEENIQKSKTTISYQGKEKKVNRLTYEITDETIKRIIQNFSNSLKNDAKLLENVASCIGISEDEILSFLDDFANSISSINSEEKLYYNVYYYGFNKIVLYELTCGDVSIQYQVEEKEIIHFMIGKEVVFSVEVQKNNNQHEFQGYFQMDGTQVPFRGTVKQHEFVTFIEVDDDVIQYSIQDTEFVEQQNHYQYQVTFSVTTTSNSIEQELMKAVIHQEIYFDEKIDVSKIDYSIDIAEISEEEMLEISENFKNHPLYQFIQNLDFENQSL